MIKHRIKTAIAVIISIAVFAVLIFLIIFAFEKKHNSDLVEQYSAKSITLSTAFTVTADTGCIGTAENSYLSVKAGVNSGAKAISADISFRKDGTPVLAEKLSDADNEAVTLERVFDYLVDKKEISMVLDIKQVTNLPEIERLATEKGLIKRLVYTGINEEQAAYLQEQSPNIRFYLDCKPDKGKISDNTYCGQLTEKALACGALGLNCSSKYISKTLVETVHSYGMLISVYGVEKELDMYRLLELGVDNITTKNPDTLYSIVSKIQANAAAG